MQKTNYTNIRYEIKQIEVAEVFRDNKDERLKITPWRVPLRIFDKHGVGLQNLAAIEDPQGHGRAVLRKFSYIALISIFSFAKRAFLSRPAKTELCCAFQHMKAFFATVNPSPFVTYSQQRWSE